MSGSLGIATEEAKALASFVLEITLSRGKVRQTGQCYYGDQAKGDVISARDT